MAMIPIDVIPCLKIPGTTIKIPISFLEKNPTFNLALTTAETSAQQRLDRQQWENLSNYLNSAELFSLNDSSSMGNFTNETTLQPDSIISNPFFLTMSAISAIGNLIMLFVVLCKQRFRKPVNLLIANLSFSSFLFIVSSNLRLLENTVFLWTYTNRICQSLAILHRIPVPVIALTTMTISLDRGRIARNPLIGNNNVNPMRRIGYIWAFSTLIVLPLGFTRTYDQCISTPYKCSKIVMFGNSTASLIYGISYLLSVHVIPALILVQETVKTINKMRFLKISGTIQQNPNFLNLPDNRLRLLRNSCIFCIIFLVFWLPYGIFQFPLDFPRDIIPEILEAYIHIYFKFFRNITYILISSNPVILFILSYDVCKHTSGVRMII